MRILAIDPVGCRGHANFNSSILRALKRLGRVTFAAFSECQGSFPVDDRIVLPGRPRTDQSKLACRIRQVKSLRTVSKRFRDGEWDCGVFLSYEVCSLFACWPRGSKTLVFNHDVNSVAASRLKSLCYRCLPRNMVHLTLAEHIAAYATERFGVQARAVPHPCHPLAYAPGFHPPKNVAAGRSGGSRARKHIFAPSGANDPALLEAIIAHVQRGNNLRLTAKGRSEKQGQHFEVRRRFDDYIERMAQCDVVLIGSGENHRYRVSGVAYDALTLGKPVVYFDCLHARSLLATHPQTVRIARSVDEIERAASAPWDFAAVEREQEVFLERHSLESIQDVLADVLGIARPARADPTWKPTGVAA